MATATKRTRAETGERLLRAGRFNHEQTVRDIVQSGADVNVRDTIGETPLLWAVINQNVDIVRLLLEKGAEVDVHNEVGKNPLCTAVSQNNMQLVRLLIENSADVNIKNRVQRSPLHKAVQHNHVDLVGFLVDRGADVNAQNKNGQTPLHKAATRDIDTVRFLLARGADVNMQNKAGQTPLHRAASKNNADIVCLLLDHGAGVNIQSKTGRTPLHKAAWGNKFDNVRLLVQRGADVNLRDKVRGSLMLKNISSILYTQHKQTPLHSAAAYNHSDALEFAKEENISFSELEDKYGKLELRMVILRRRTPLVSYLVKEGAVLPPLSESYYSEKTVIEYVGSLSATESALIEFILEALPNVERDRVIDKANLRLKLFGGAVNRLRYAQETVQSLKKHCRKTIRKSLITARNGLGMSSGIKRLPLPGAAQKFLMFDELTDDGRDYNLHLNWFNPYGYGYDGRPFLDYNSDTSSKNDPDDWVEDYTGIGIKLNKI